MPQAARRHTPEKANIKLFRKVVKLLKYWNTRALEQRDQL